MKESTKPIITVDAVILVDNRRKIVLIQRKNPPFRGWLALPGGFVEIGETVEEACVREAYEETNISVKIVKLIGVFSDPKRDPRGHIVSIAFLCIPLTKNEKPIAKDDAAALKIVNLVDISSSNLAFDHMEIIKRSGILNNLE